MSETMEFSTFAKVAEELEREDKNTIQTEILADLLLESGEDLGIVARFSKGDIFPAWDERKVSVGNSLIYDALAAASGNTETAIEDRVADVGGPGEVCKTLDLSPDTGQVTLFDNANTLAISRVYETFKEISATEGTGSQQAKVEAIKNLLFDASGREAKYIVRLLLGKMRIGVGEGTVRDAIARAFEMPIDAVERGIMVTNDVEIVARTARDGSEDELRELAIEIGRPIKLMLARKGTKSDAITEAGDNGEVVVEWKFDGARLQGHIDGDEVHLFTRRMNDVTDSMPDVCDIMRDHVTAEQAIIDCEVVAYAPDSTEPEPFQEVMKRLRRKYDIEETAEEINLDIHTFDVLYADGETLIDKTIRARRTHLESVVTGDILADQWKASETDVIADLEDSSLEAGHEGVMVKDPSSTYQPDNRGKNWLKIKPDVETLDCVIVGGEWGEGRRAKWVGTFMLAVQDDETGEFKKIGKVATGLSDAQLTDLTTRFEPLIESESGKDIKFRPEIVFEVGTEEIQPSPQYSSGFGLRFPRFLAVREDKEPEDADTVQRVERLYEQQ